MIWRYAIRAQSLLNLGIQASQLSDDLFLGQEHQVGSQPRRVVTTLLWELIYPIPDSTVRQFSLVGLVFAQAIAGPPDVKATQKLILLVVWRVFTFESTQQVLHVRQHLA